MTAPTIIIIIMMARETALPIQENETTENQDQSTAILARVKWMIAALHHYYHYHHHPLFTDLWKLSLIVIIPKEPLRAAV